MCTFTGHAIVYLCHVIARDISRFHSVFLWTGYRYKTYNFKSKLSNVKSKNAAFVNI